jgi:hypothetical protein
MPVRRPLGRTRNRQNGRDYEHAGRVLFDQVNSSARENSFETEGVRANARRAGVETDSSPEFVLTSMASASMLLDDIRPYRPRDVEYYLKYEPEWHGVSLTESEVERIVAVARRAHAEEYRYVEDFLRGLMRDAAIEELEARPREAAWKSAKSDVARAVERTLDRRWPQWSPSARDIERVMDTHSAFDRFKRRRR